MKNTSEVFHFSRLLSGTPSCKSFFIFRTSFSENTSIKLLQFFVEDGPAYRRKMMTGYLRQKHNVVIAEKRVSSQFTAQRRTSTAGTVNLISYREDYFGHKLHIDQNENLKICLICFAFYVSF